MPQDKILTFERLGEIWKSEDYPLLDIEGNKYVMLSDLHLGDGSKADDAFDNREAILAALRHYKAAGFKLILLGDVEDLWQFTVREVKSKYQDSIYRAINEFGDDMTYRIFGNHDADWRVQPDPIKKQPFLPAEPEEAVKLRDKNGEIRILLVHGHQGSIDSDKDSWSSRFWVRVFRVVEPLAKKIGFTRHAPAIKCEVCKEYEQIMYSWAKENKVLLICGHSHNAIFASLSYTDRLKERIKALEAAITSNSEDPKLVRKYKAELKENRKEIKWETRNNRDILPAEPGATPLPCYFNTGCGIYEDGITGIEIAEGKITLAKWHRDPKRPEVPPRREIYQEGSLEDYFNEILRG